MARLIPLAHFLVALTPALVADSMKAAAQMPGAPPAHANEQPANPAPSQATAHIMLGIAAMPLYGPWKFKAAGSRQCAGCLALPIEADGAVTLEVFGGAGSSVMQFELKPADRLVLRSDRIAEAMDANGQLVGF